MTKGCVHDTDGDGNCPLHLHGCPKPKDEMPSCPQCKSVKVICTDNEGLEFGCCDCEWEWVKERTPAPLELPVAVELEQLRAAYTVLVQLVQSYQMVRDVDIDWDHFPETTLAMAHQEVQDLRKQLKDDRVYAFAVDAATALRSADFLLSITSLGKDSLARKTVTDAIAKFEEIKR